MKKAILGAATIALLAGPASAESEFETMQKALHLIDLMQFNQVSTENPPSILGEPEQEQEREIVVSNGIHDDVGAEVPLPAAAWMLLAGIGGLAGVRRFRRA